MTLEDKITLIYFLGWSSTEKRMRDALNARYRRLQARRVWGHDLQGRMIQHQL